MADDVEALIRLNLTGPIELTRLLLPGMLQRKQGYIVNISSMGGRIGFTRVLRTDYRKARVSSSVIILGSIGGAGTGARTMEEMNLHLSTMDKAFLSPPEAVAQAVLKSIRRDKAEIVIMPGPGRLMRGLMDIFSGMGSLMGQMGASVMKQVVDFRERQRAQGDTNARPPAEQR